MQRTTGKCKSHARHSTGLQLSSDMPAGLPWTGLSLLVCSGLRRTHHMG